MAERHDPGREPDRPDYRHCRPPTPCEGRVPAIATPDGLPRWCPGHVEVWQRRRWGADPKVHGPDGWWAWGNWYLEPGKRWGGWLHESEVAPRTSCVIAPTSPRERSVSPVMHLESPPSAGGEAHILPNWVKDGEPIVLLLRGFTEYAGQTVNIVVEALTAFETAWCMTISARIDALGNAEARHDAGLQLGRHAAIWVTGIQPAEIVPGAASPRRFTNVLISIANSPTPGTTLDEVMQQFGELQAAQRQRYEQPLGDMTAPGAIRHRALCVLEGLSMTTVLRVPGARIQPIADRLSDPQRVEIMNTQLSQLGWPTRVPEDRWLAATSNNSPMTSIVMPELWATDLDEATELVRDTIEKLTGILALNRRATARSVAFVIEQEGDDEIRYRVAPGGPIYTGNLLGGFIAGEDQGELLQQYEGANADPLLRLCCALFAEALAERSVDARFLRLWSILEFLSGARVAAGQTVTLRDGSPWPNPQSNSTSTAAPRVYAYLDQSFNHLGIPDERSFVEPATDLYEAVRAWYGRRNATGHYGRLVVGDPAQTGQNWYQWALRTTTDEWRWLDALQRTVQDVIRIELGAAAPPA